MKIIYSFILLSICFLCACTFAPYDPGTGLNQPAGSVNYPPPHREAYPDCNATAIECNCRYTSAVPEQVAPTRMCKSGYMEFGTCGGYCPGGGLSWGTQCTCH